MNWRGISNRVYKRKADGHNSGRRPRHWPVGYLFAALLLLLFLSSVTLKQPDRFYVKTVSGDNLKPTPWHGFHKPTRTFLEHLARPFQILWCTHFCSLQADQPKPSSARARRVDRSCPAYFQWIHNDLAPWAKTGITEYNLEFAKDHAAFRVIIVDGRLYVDLYYTCTQTRALFTIWGILMLLEKYKGMVPDVDLMFDCMDRPHLEKVDIREGFWSPPVLFRYCSSKNHFDIPFPDWSFWGWSETKLGPWDQEFKKIVKGAAKMDWTEKKAMAHWRGNPNVGSPLRENLLKCNNTTKHPSKADILTQDWQSELSVAKQHSKLENQCKHRFKIYAEGFAWSVSFKYILACGSATMVISPAYYDFFSRGLQPMVDYIPLRPQNICASKMCPTINGAVDWGNDPQNKAERIGMSGQQFLEENVNMDAVYDYMFHLLHAYANLQKFRPSVSPNAREVTDKLLLCLAKPEERELLLQSQKFLFRSTSRPCEMSSSTLSSTEPLFSSWEAEEQSVLGMSDGKCGKKTQL